MKGRQGLLLNLYTNTTVHLTQLLTHLSNCITGCLFLSLPIIFPLLTALFLDLSNTPQQLLYSPVSISVLCSRLSLALLISLPPTRSFVISHLVFPSFALLPHFTLSFPSWLSVHIRLTLFLIPPPRHSAASLQVSVYVLVVMLVVEEWEGWRGRWREEAPGRRRCRGLSVSRGCHGNRLSQPVGAVLVNGQPYMAVW